MKRFLYSKFLVTLLLLEVTAYADNKQDGVVILKNEEKNMFLYSDASNPSKVKSIARDIDVGLIHAEARFISDSKIIKTSVFAFHPNGREKLRLATAEAPCLIFRNHRYIMSEIYYHEFINNKWSDEKKASLGGRMIAFIPINPNAEKVRVTKIQFK